MPSYNTRLHLRSYSGYNHINFRRLITKLSKENVDEHPHIVRQFAIRVSYTRLNQLLRAVPYSYHLLETYTTQEDIPADFFTYIIVPYNWTKVNILVNVIEGILGYHPYALPSGHSTLTIAYTYLVGPPAVCLVQFTSTPNGIEREQLWV